MTLRSTTTSGRAPPTRQTLSSRCCCATWCIQVRYLVYPAALPGVSCCVTWCMKELVYPGLIKDGFFSLDVVSCAAIAPPARPAPPQNTRLRSDGAAPTPGLCCTQALPWCGVCFFGIGTGFEFGTDPRRAAKRAGTCPAVAHGAAARPFGHHTRPLGLYWGAQLVSCGWSHVYGCG